MYVSLLCENVFLLFFAPFPFSIFRICTLVPICIIPGKGVQGENHLP